MEKDAIKSAHSSIGRRRFLAGSIVASLATVTLARTGIIARVVDEVK